MRIAVLTNHFPPQRGGISRYTYALVSHWVAQGHPVLTASTVPPEKNIFDLQNDLNGKFIYINKRIQNYVDALTVFTTFFQQVKCFKPDLLFFPIWDPYSIFMPFIFTKKYPYAIGTHAAEILGLSPGSSYQVNRLVKKLGQLSLRHSNQVLTVSHYTARLLENFRINREKISVFPNGVDYQFFTPENIERQQLFNKFGIQYIPGHSVLLTVAKLNPRKGIDTGIRVFKRLHESGNKNVIYLIIGSGNDFTRLKGLIEKLSLQEHVFILTNISDNDLLQFYNSCDIFLLLSRLEGDMNVEGFGIALLEANACEKPVIAGNSGGIPDAVEHGRNGYLVDPNDEREITQKIENLLSDTNKAQSMGKYGRERVIQRFNWDQISRQMITQFEKIL